MNVELLNAKFCIDSRRVEPGCVFVAIRGRRFDGHDFVREALEKGASLAIVEKPVGTGREIVVDDAVEFLMRLASEKMRNAEIVIGVTGSSGKTFTKELLSRLVPGSFKTIGNLNTEIGLPLSVLNHYSGERIAILEMGMNKVGDIGKLCRVAKPDIGVVLNVGLQHVGVAGSPEEVFRGKMEMVDRSERVVIPSDDPRIVDYVERSGKEYLGFGEGGDVELMCWNYTDWRTRARFRVFGGDVEIELNRFWHRGHLRNLAASICVLKWLEVDFDPERLREFEFMEGRFHQEWIGGVFVIDDTYNASLSAFEAAVEAIDRMDFRRKFAVVGPIKELGPYSERIHAEVSKILEDLDGVFVYSRDEDSRFLKPSNEISRSPDPRELALEIVNTVREGDLVIFKASRSVELERVLREFRRSIV